MIGTELFVFRFTQLSLAIAISKRKQTRRICRSRDKLKSSFWVAWFQWRRRRDPFRSIIIFEQNPTLTKSKPRKGKTIWRRHSIIHSSANVTVKKNSLCQKRAWVEDWKKILFQETKTNSISYIFFQSSTLGQIDDEISRLLRSKKIICRIVEWEIGTTRGKISVLTTYYCSLSRPCYQLKWNCLLHFLSCCEGRH